MNDVLEVSFATKTRDVLGMLAENRSRRLSSLLPLSIVVAAFAVLTIVVGAMSRSWTAIGLGLGLAALAGLGLWSRQRQASAIAPAPIPELAFSIDDQQIHFTKLSTSRATTWDWPLAETTLEVRPGGRVLAFSREGQRPRRFSLAGLDIDPNQLVSFFDSRKAACSSGSAPARELLDAPRPQAGPERKYYETPMLAVVFPVISIASIAGGVAITVTSVLTKSHGARESHTDPRGQLWMMALIMIAVAVEMQRRHFAYTKFRWRNDTMTVLYWVLMAVAIVGALVGPFLLPSFSLTP